MNNEIKEILDFKENADYKRLSCDEIAILIDYITKLQQEDERLKTKTKEQNLLLIDYQDMEQKLEDYKSRIEKAVEYINKKWEEHTYYERNENHLGFCEFSEFEKTDLLDILNGRSVE